MAVNWPPAEGTYPAWPPPEMGAASALREMYAFLRKHGGYTNAAPTAAERAAYFNNTQCSDGHNVVGRMLVSPDGLKRWPFCVCNNNGHRQALVLWPPYELTNFSY